MGAQTDTGLAFNAHIEALLAQGEFAIDLDLGFAALTQYWHEVALISAGVPFSEIGFSRRREASFPSILVPNTAKINGLEVVNWQPDDWGTMPSAPKGSIAVLKLRGPMQAEDGLSSRGVESLVSDLNAAFYNENISAVLLDVFSPGGSAIAADMLASTIENRNKPVIAHITGYAASGAYWASAPADEIIAASPKVEVGSIGAYMVVDKKALDLYRERFISVYSDLSPDKNKAGRMALSGDLSGIKEIVNQTARDFHEVVTKFRNLSGDRLTQKETLSGGMFPATEARSRGLIDGIGGLPYALERTAAWMKKKRKA